MNDRVPATCLQVRPHAHWIYAALVAGLCLWVLQPFVQALLAAGITALASWPLYRRFRFRTRRIMSATASTGLFTFVIGVFVLAPLVFALGALVVQAHGLLVQVAEADRNGAGVGQWLRTIPVAGRYVSDVWGEALDRPGSLLGWAQRADPAALLGLAQSLGHFMARHLFIVLFTLLALYFFYDSGRALVHSGRIILRDWIGARADAYVRLASRAARASVNGMLMVALFDGCVCALAYAIAGVPDPAVWGAITGALALVPFLGYVAVGALALRLAISGAGGAAALSFALGALVLFVGDKAVRPAVTREGTRLSFVWVLMSCLGGFEALGLVGLVIGPVALTLARELWDQRVRDLEARARG